MKSYFLQLKKDIPNDIGWIRRILSYAFDWYVGGMTDWTAREMEIDFSFLTPGKKYKAEIYKDGYDANIYADQYVFVNQEIDNNSKLNIKLASGGGVAIRIVPLE